MSTIRYPQQCYGYRHLIAMAAPLILSFLLEQAIGMMDVAFLGRLGPVPLGAAAPAGVAFLTLLMLGVGYTMGVQAYMSRRNGEKAYDKIGAAFQSGALFLLVLALVLTALTVAFSSNFFQASCQSAAVAEAADQYLFWRVLGLGGAFLTNLYRAYFVATLRPNILLTSSALMLGTNALLNYALIFGAGPFPALGIAGAAIASTLSELVCLAVFVIYSVRSGSCRTYGLYTRLAISWSLERTLWRLGRYLMIQEAFAFAAWLVFFMATEHLGETDLAVSNIVRQIASLLFLLIHGFGAACAAVASNLLGQNRAQDVPVVLKKGLWLTTLGLAPLIGLVALLPEAVLAIFTDMPSVIGASKSTLWVMLGSYALAVPSMFLLFVIAGIGLTREASIAGVVATIGYLLYIALIVNLTDNVAVVWTADYVYYGLSGLICAYVYRQGHWKHRAL